MINAEIVIRSRKPRRPPFTISGTLPFPGSPLAITPRVYWAESGWKVDDSEWMITHVPSGFNLGAYVWERPNEALAVLLQCDPTFPAWAFLTGMQGDSATMACREKFKMAFPEAAEDA